MRLFWEYLCSHRRTLLLWAVMCIVFAVVFALFRLPVEAVGYGCAISAFIGAVFAVPDFLRFRKRHLLMKCLLNEISLTAENLPAADSLPESDLRELILRLFEDKMQLENELNARYADMTEYYTLWAHQIKTPIAAMRLTLHGDETEKGRSLSEDLQRIEQYVEMVLCYIRLDSSVSDFVIKKYDLDGIVKQAVRRFSSQFIGKKLSLTYEPLCCEVLTDEKWLLFVIEQVISNALKYTRSGGIRIYLEAPKTLCISDSGIGIAPEDVPRAFERGYTGCNGRTDKKASGIGLYLCRRICGRLGHGISAESEIGKGTTIKLCLSETKIEIE